MTIGEARYNQSALYSSESRIKLAMIKPEPVAEHPLESALSIGSSDPKHFEAPAKRIDSVINLGGSGDNYVPNTELACSFKDSPNIMAERRKFVAAALKMSDSEAFPGSSLVDPASGKRIQDPPCGVLRQSNSPRRVAPNPVQDLDRKTPIASAASVSEMILKAMQSESEPDIPEEIPALPEEEKKMDEPVSSKPEESREENEMPEDLFGSTAEEPVKKRKEPERKEVAKEEKEAVKEKKKEKRKSSSSSSSEGEEERPYSFASKRDKKKKKDSSSGSSSSDSSSSEEQAPKRAKRKTAPVKRFYDEALEGLEETADHKLVKKGTAVKPVAKAATTTTAPVKAQPKGPAVVKRAVVKVAEVNNSLYNMRIFYENSDSDQMLFINFEGIEKIAIAEAASSDKRMVKDYPINRELRDKFQQDLFNAIGQRFLFTEETDEPLDYVKLYTERFNAMQNPDGTPNDKNIHWVLIFICWNYAEFRLLTDKNGSDRVVALFGKSVLPDFESCSPRLEIRKEAVTQLCWMRNACWPFRMLQLRARDTVAEHSKHNPQIKSVKEQVSRLFADESKHRTATLFVLWINFCELVGLKSVIEVSRPDL